jgi:tricarballylate dehydrogenase
VTAAYDVVVVGAGNAALAAAVRAAELGARVLVLKAAPEEHHGGNSGHAGANFPSLASSAAIRPSQTPATT